MKIEKLILVGHRKNYIVPFNPGVNIIYGDADTGKSSILKIIYYLLGSKPIQVDHEIQSSVKYAVLEVTINDSRYCIKRDLYNANRFVEVFSCDYEEMGDNFPEKYSPSLASDPSEMKSLSEFIFGELNFPNVKLKQAPTKENSGLSRISIRDLFKFCYLDQDDVGSKSMLNIGNPVVEVKNREVFKYIFNVLDTNITDVDGEISEKSREKSELENQFKIISKFLFDTEFDSIEKIDDQISNIEDEVDVLQKQLDDINKRIVADSELYNGFKDALDTINLKIIEQETIKASSVTNLDRFSRLQNDYLNDIEKLKSIQKANEVIGMEMNATTTCPICDSQMEISGISESFSITDNDKVKHEINSINRRIKDLNYLIADNRREITNSSSLLDNLNLEKEKAKLFIDQELEKSISPYLTERDAIIGESAILSERRDRFRHILKVRNQHVKIADRIGKLESDIVRLKEKLERLKGEAPSINTILTQLGAHLDTYLEHVHIKNRKNVLISEKTFLPVVRGIEYRHVNSGGMRTIISIGYLAILLRSGIKLDINLPNLMMVDTVGKYLGKTKDKYQLDTDNDEDYAEGISDPEKYANIYKYLINMAEEFEEEGELCQILLVDNDVPQEIAEKYDGFVVAHYSSEGAHGLPVGLIDDWDDANS